MTPEELDGVEAELVDVERALERLDDGSYGTCERCGTAMGGEVLDRAPAARTCASHPVPEWGR